MSDRHGPAQPTTTPGRLSVGATLGEGDRYTLGGLVGTGGMASVWTAHDSRLDRTVAIKVISDSLALDPQFVERFAREARVAARMSHPHVVTVHDYGTYGGRPYLVMEHVEGGTLADRLREGRRGWDPVVLAGELLGALAYVHGAGILHRDLKPANVLVGADGRARLTDFGIAQLADATRLTSTGTVMGTEQYSAPEVLGGGPPTERSDLYSCGVLLRACANEPPALGPLIEALTRRDPSARPPSAQAALELLTAPDAQPTAVLPSNPAPSPAPTKVLTSVGAPPAAAGPAAAAPTPAKRRNIALPLVVLAGALAVVVVAAIGLRGGDDPRPLRLPETFGSTTEQLQQLDEAVEVARRG